MDSLRYWVVECHVDGFRFDLASALAREFCDVDRLSAFFDVIHQDPVLSQVKLIAEPWDVGPGGYQVGNFPVLWTEWNGLYRDTVRDFWRGATNGVGEFASRLTGSSDLYADGRAATGRVDQLHHRPRRLHPAPTSSRTTRSTTRRTSRTTATAPTTTAPGTAASRAPTDDPEVNALAPPPAAQLPRDAVPLAGRADAARRRRARRARSAATTTPGARTTSSRGSTGRSPTTSASCSSSRGG